MADADCKVTRSWRGRTAVLNVEGAVDMRTAQILKSALAACFSEKPATLLVDLASTEFLASSGIRVLLWAQEQAGAARIRFGVIADSAATSRPIKLLGLAESLNLHPNLDDAQAFVGGDGDQRSY